MRILTESDVAAVLDPDLALAAVEAGLRALSGGDAIQPLRSVLRVSPQGTKLGLMPGYLPDGGTLGMKSVAVCHANSGRGLPTHQAAILLTDAATGIPRALLDGRLITEVRTAAASALATRELAAPGACRLAILGSGVQARSHLEAISRVRALEWVRVWSPRAESRERLAADEAAVRGFRVEPATSPEEALAGADLVVAATASPAPVIFAGMLSAGMHLNAVGACVPHTRELEGAAVARCRTWVDSLESAWSESGDLILAREERLISNSAVVGELGALLLGRIQGRGSASEITLFKSLGVAVEDLATAEAVLSRAEERGLGTEVDLSA